MNYLIAFILTCFLSLPGAAAAAAAKDDRIVIEKPGETTAIPISLSGYLGEVNSVLQFDLYVAGFKLVDPESAQYNVTGDNATQVQGRVIDRFSKAIITAKSYSGGTLRSQAHAWANEIIQAITGKPGITQSKIAFKADYGGYSELYIADYDGANAVSVTQDRSVVAAPCWVPGQRILYYTSYKSGFPDIYSYDLSSGARKPIARYSGLNTSAAVARDGRVAMILSKEGSPDLYVANPDGAGLKRLTKTREDESSPCWSPDGAQICFVSRSEGSPLLYLIPSGGGKMSRIPTGTASATEPDWSPDGKYITFTRLGRTFEIWIYEVASQVTKPLLAGEDATWGPNSRTLLFTRRMNNKRVLSLLDVPTKHVKDLHQNLGSCSQPSWAK